MAENNGEISTKFLQKEGMTHKYYQTRNNSGNIATMNAFEKKIIS